MYSCLRIGCRSSHVPHRSESRPSCGWVMSRIWALYMWVVSLICAYTATHCNTLQHTATHCNTLQHTALYIWVVSLICVPKSHTWMRRVTHISESCWSVLQCVAVCCSVLQCVAGCCSVLQCVAVCCSVLQCVAVCCSVLQCVAVCCSVSAYERHNYRRVISHTSVSRVSCHSYMWVMSHMWVSRVLHMGWLQLVGSLKL